MQKDVGPKGGVGEEEAKVGDDAERTTRKRKTEKSAGGFGCLEGLGDDSYFYFIILINKYCKHSNSF